MPDIPIRTFVTGRAASVEEQLGRIGAGQKGGGSPAEPAEAPPH